MSYKHRYKEITINNVNYTIVISDLSYKNLPSFERVNYKESNEDITHVVDEDGRLSVFVKDEMGVLVKLTVNPADMGKIIGRQGNTAKAIRTLLRVIGMKNNSRVNLKINEPEGGTKAAGVEASLDEAMEDLKNM